MAHNASRNHLRTGALCKTICPNPIFVFWQSLCDTIVISASNVLVALMTTTLTRMFTNNPTKNSESLVRIEKKKILKMILYHYWSLCAGGENVENANPWFVFVVFKPPGRFERFRCGASLLNRN